MPLRNLTRITPSLTIISNWLGINFEFYDRQGTAYFGAMTHVKLQLTPERARL